MNRQQRIDDEKQTVERVAGLIAPPETEDADYPEIERKGEEVRRLIDELSSDVIFADVFGMAGNHPSSYVRHDFPAVAADLHRESVFARRYLCERTHDDADFVALDTITTCGKLEPQEAYIDFLDIVHPARRPRR
jgi:hypothetical protein